MLRTATIVQLLFIVLAALTVFGFVQAAQSDQRRSSCSALCAMQPAYAGRDRIAPDFELPDMDGKMVKLSSYRGKTVVLNFWTKTCRPCLEEMPSIGKLAEMLKNRKDIAIVTVTIDEGPDDVRDTLKVALNADPTFPVLFDSESKIVLDRYGTKLFPETWIIDPSGVIRARMDGPRDWTSPLIFDVLEMVSRPSGCPVEFYKSVPRGKFAPLCADEG